MKKILAIQICAFLIVAGALGGLLYTTNVYDNVKSSIVTLLCLSCIKLNSKTQLEGTFDTATGGPHSDFVLNNLTKGPVFLAYRQDVCAACDEMEPIVKEIFDVEFEPEETLVQTVILNNTNVTFIHINLDHTSDELKKIVHEQFATKVFDEKGKSTSVVDYTVSSNPATNQLVVRCPMRDDIDAVLETLNQIDVKPIQVKIDCLISEVYADMTFDRETTIAIDNLFGESVTMNPAGTAFGADVQQLVQDDEYLPAFPGASLREVARSRMGLNIGYLNAAKAGRDRQPNGVGHIVHIGEVLLPVSCSMIQQRQTIEGPIDEDADDRFSNTINIFFDTFHDYVKCLVG